MRVLITSCSGAAARNFIKSLNHAGGYTTVGIDSDADLIRLANTQIRHLVPRRDDPAFIPALQELIDRYQIDALIPQADDDVTIIARENFLRQTFTEITRLPTFLNGPQSKIVQMNVLHKHVPVAAWADTTRFTIEQAFTIVNNWSASRKIKWIRYADGSGSKGALPVRTMEQAAAWIDYWATEKGADRSRWIISEYLPGREAAFQSVWHEGELITSCARERVSHFFAKQMPSGQSSTPAVARIIHDDDVNTTAIAAIETYVASQTEGEEKPHGVYCVDVRQDAIGTWCVTELNVGRFFTTSHFMTVAGCNMPDLHTRLHPRGAIEGEFKRTNACNEGATWTRGIDTEPVYTDGSDDTPHTANGTASTVGAAHE